VNTVRQYIDHHAATKPEDTFLISPADDNRSYGQLTFSELKEQVDSIGSSLSAIGIEPQDKVAFLLNNGQWATLLFLAVMANRRVIVPINAAAGGGW